LIGTAPLIDGKAVLHVQLPKPGLMAYGTYSGDRHYAMTILGGAHSDILAKYESGFKFRAMRKRALLTGIVLWVAGALTIRLGGQYIFRLNLLLLYLLSFAAMAVLVPRILGGMGLEKDAWPAAATLLMLPTLILDSFACAFFSSIYPNLSPAAAGAFGGWMLIFCGGAAAGAWGGPLIRLRHLLPSPRGEGR